MAAEPGPVTRALLDLARYGDGDHALAVRLCRACTSGVEVDGAAVSRLTASALRETLCTTDATAPVGPSSGTTCAPPSARHTAATVELVPRSIPTW